MCPSTHHEISTLGLQRLPVFPLPDAVLIPQGVLPLHVFEPRYRELVKDCYGSNRFLIIASQAAEEHSYLEKTELQPVAGAGRIEHYQLEDDGRSLIVVRGLMRVDLVAELETDRPYRIMRAQARRDVGGGRPEQALESLQLLKRLVWDLAEQVPRGELLAAACRETVDAAEIADLVGAALISEQGERQRFLAERCPSRRVDLAVDAAAVLLGRLAGGRVEALN